MGSLCLSLGELPFSVTFVNFICSGEYIYVKGHCKIYLPIHCISFSILMLKVGEMHNNTLLKDAGQS